ncbi:MAG: polymer-forming cytoskeletal protein [Burkholderiaceae bacterium]
MFRKKANPKTTIDSLIGATTRLEGDVVFQGGLRIDGYVRGDVIAGEGSAGLLVIGENGRVDGNIVAVHLIVSGTVHGSVTVSNLVELQPKAKLSGELRYRSVEVHPGAMVEGILSHFDGDLVRPDLRIGGARDTEAAASSRSFASRNHTASQ